MEHVRDRLSEYLDNELAGGDRARVEGHISACAECNTHLSELRATAQLMSGLPVLRPSRPLVTTPRPVRVWFRPLRSLGAVAAGLFIFAFMASATLETGSRFGGAGSRGGSLIGGTTSDAPASVREDSGALQQPATLSGSTSSAQSRAAAPENDVAAPAQVEPPKLGPTPWLWAGLALLSAGVALFAHRRLRRV